MAGDKLPSTPNVEEYAQYLPVQTTGPDRSWSLGQLKDSDDCMTDPFVNGNLQAFIDTNQQAANTARGEKSPRRSDLQCEGSVPGVRAKKPRRSLFGGAGEDMEHIAPFADVSAPAIPGQGIGNRMSSLNLDQQVASDEAFDRSINNGFGLACSDIGSVRDSPVPSDEELVIPPDDVAPYELRQNIDRKKAFTYVDTDKSGNWDPEQQAKDRAAKLVRAKATKRQKKEIKKTKGKKSGTRDCVMKCIARLPFERFGNVRNITNDEQKWPEDWSDIDSEQERELEEYRAAYRVNTPDRRQQPPLLDPANAVDDLTGYPAARGCKQCRKHEQACSMIKGGKYPCEECTEDGSECQPIREPAVKSRCKQCDQAEREFCSFENDPTQAKCDHCADDDHMCEALPPFGYKAQRVDLDEIAYGPNRPFIACTSCRFHKKRCSLKRKEDKPPCKFCNKNGVGCKFTEVPKSSTGKPTAKNPVTLLEEIAPEVLEPSPDFFTPEDLADMGQSTNEARFREPTPEIEMEDSEGNKGMLTKLTTSFAHPIRFGIAKSALSNCNFCQLPIFGIVGHFEKKVHVIRWHSGLGFAEVGGGHCQNEGETIMCEECTNRRLQILCCPNHEFESTADANVSFDALADELNQAQAEGADMKYQIQRWCSLCFSPASFGCNTVQESLVDETQEITGCHLRLCVACEKALREVFGGDLNEMATEMDKKPKISEADEILGAEIAGRPRADVGFLKQEGLLLLTVQAEG